MKACGLFENCPLFDEVMRKESVQGKTIISEYCKGDFENCARYRVHNIVGKESVDTFLMPHMLQTADKIINMNVVETK
jgi:hypothetical protein